MKHGSLESGLGGFDFAAEQAGFENVFHCEINTFCQTVLKYYWPHAESFTDIFEFDGKPWRGKVDIITAGFPCQPFSNAGKRKGTTDDRFIWPENMRIFREIKPRFIVAENVPGLLTIENGMVFEQVCSDLENEGYEVQTLIIPACAKDAVHRRDRVWIVANDWEQRFQGSIQTNSSEGSKRNDKFFNGCNRERNESWIEAATRLCSMDDESTGRLDTASISKSKWRTESLKAYGNAIYWPIAFEIFNAIEETEKQTV